MNFIYYVLNPTLAFSALTLKAGLPSAPTPSGPKPASLSDFDLPTAEEGRPYVIVFGTCTIRGPNVAWYGDLSTQKIKSKAKKKG